MGHNAEKDAYLDAEAVRIVRIPEFTTAISQAVYFNKWGALVRFVLDNQQPFQMDHRCASDCIHGRVLPPGAEGTS